jgi:hypothetical protein
LALSILKFAYKIARIGPERGCDTHDVGQAHVPLATLDGRHVREVESRLVRKSHLTPAEFFPSLPDAPAELGGQRRIAPGSVGHARKWM